MIQPLSSWTPLNYNPKSPFHLDSTSIKTRNNSHHERKYICTISKCRRPWVPHTSVSPLPLAYWVSALPLTPVVLANLCIYPDICFGFLSPFKTPSGYRAFPCTQAHLAGVLTSCLVLTVLSMKAELSYLDPPTTQGGSAIYHLKPQFHPSLDF